MFVTGAPLRKNDYVSFYAVKETLTGDQYNARYPVGATSLTEDQIRDKDYIIKYDSNHYIIGDHREPMNPLGVAQYFNCSKGSSRIPNNCKLIPVTIGGEKMFVGKITATVVNVDQQLFAAYNRGLVIPKHVIRQPSPPQLSTTAKVTKTSTAVASTTPNTPDVTYITPPQGDYCVVVPQAKCYGYSSDSLWEITMCIPGDRDTRRNHFAHIRNLGTSEDQAVTYLLDIEEKIFQLHIKSTNILYSSTIGDGSCGFRALRQADKRAAIPSHLRATTPIKDLDYNVPNQRLDQISWVQNIIDASSPSADIANLRIYNEWLKIPDLPLPGVRDRSSYNRTHRGMNGWMATNDCHALASTLPYIGLFTIVGHAILNKATYLFYSNSKTKHHGIYPGKVLVDLAESGNYIGFSQIHFYLLPSRLSDEQRLRSAVLDIVRNVRARAGDGKRPAWSFTHNHSPPQECIFPYSHFISNKREKIAKCAQMTKFNNDCKKSDSTTASRQDIAGKLLSLGLEPVDVPADGNCFLYAAQFTLLQLHEWNINVIPNASQIRVDVTRYLSNAKDQKIYDGRTLDTVREEMRDAPTTVRRRTPRLEQYDSWYKYITYMRQPDKYADVLFAYGLSHLYNVSICIISDIFDEPQIYHLGNIPPQNKITLCYLPVAQHYYATRELAPPLIRDIPPLHKSEDNSTTSTMTTTTATPTHQELQDLMPPADLAIQEPNIIDTESVGSTQSNNKAVANYPCFEIGVSTTTAKTKKHKQKPSRPRAARPEHSTTTTSRAFHQDKVELQDIRSSPDQADLQQDTGEAGDDTTQDAHMSQQITKRLRPKRKSPMEASNQQKMTKRQKQEEQHKRPTNPVSRQMASAKSKAKKAQSKRDKKAHSSRHQSVQGKSVNGESAGGALPSSITTYFKTKRHRQEPATQDVEEQDRQGSPERKRRGVCRNKSSMCSECAPVVSHAKADFVVPGVQQFAASEANSNALIVFFAGPPLPVLDNG